MNTARIDGKKIKTNWTAKEVAVLAGLDLDEVFDNYIKYVCSYSKLRRPASWLDIQYTLQKAIQSGDTKTLDEISNPKLEIFSPFSAYLRSHIQEILKGQEGKDGKE